MTSVPYKRAFLAACLVAAFAGSSVLVGCSKQHSPAESIALAKAARAKGDAATASIELKNALQQDAGNGEARLMLAETYLDLGQGSEAEIELRRLADSGFDTRQLVVLTGRSLMMQGNFNRLISEVTPASDLDPAQNSEISELRGQAFFALGQYDNAAKAYAQSLVDQPGNPDALVGQAQLAMYALDFPGAMRLVDQVLASVPDHLRALLLKADVQRYSGKRDEAMATYRQLLDKYPNNARALSSYAYMQIAADDYDGASKSIERIRAFGNGAATASYLSATLEYRKKNYTAARDHIQKALSMAANHLPSVMLGGSIEYQLGSYEQAERLLRQVVAASPATVYARQVLAMTLLKEGRGADAVEVLAPILGQTSDPKLFMLAGDAYTRAKQYAKATDAYARASAIDPSNAGSKLRLGVSRLASGDADRALADMAAAVELQPDNSQADFVMIVTRIRRGELDPALAAVKTMIERQPTNPIAPNLEGGIWLAKKDVAKARAAFGKALELDPTFTPAVMNLAKIDLIENKPEEARKRFKAFVDRDPKNIEALVAYSNLLRELKAPRADVLAPLDQARAADPKAIEPRLLYVQNVVGTDPKMATPVAKEAFAIDPRNPQVLDALGLTQVANGEQSAALATYSRLVEVAPTSQLGRQRLAELYLQSGNEVAAARELRTILTANPTNRDAQLMLVGIEGRAGRSAEALKIAQQMQKESPKLVMGYVLEGDVYMSSKRPQQAAAAYDRALEIARSSPLMTKIHASYVAAGKTAEANAKIGRWLADHPEDGFVRTYYGNYLLRTGQNRLAIEQYELVLQKEPDTAVALNDLAWLYGQAKDPRAIPTATRAYELKPSDGHIADTLGSLLLEAGQTQKGIDVLRKASEESPKLFGLKLHLANAYLKTGDTTKARQQLESVANGSNDMAERTEANKLLAALAR